MTRRTWVLSTSFSHSPSVLGPKAINLLHSNLSLAIHSGKVPSFKHFLLAPCPALHPVNSLVRELWEELHGCGWSGSGVSTQSSREGAQKSPGLENVTVVHSSASKLSDLTATYQAYLAAKTRLVACQNLMSCSPGDGSFLRSTCTNAWKARPWQVSSQDTLPSPHPSQLAVSHRRVGRQHGLRKGVLNLEPKGLGLKSLTTEEIKV